MTMTGNISLRLESPATAFTAAQTRFVRLEPMTFVQIEPGVPFSIANIRNSPTQGNAETLAISVIPPICPPSPFFP
jgi:hypothetical protein